MAKWIKRFAVGLIALFIVVQIVPVARVNPTKRGQPPAPREVQAVLQRACYDCHSNETRWPWYSRVAPVSFLIARDVTEGRSELNFSTWSQYNERRKTRKLKEIAEQVEKGKMPQWYYVSLHPEAKLSAADRELIIKWARRS
ncbi:MAG: heme-binding domain-containing protein [Candidatus Binatia bacterium]|nr:heme-binding domain-containing protein [Candidatus Binatia bacterium]